MTNELAGKLALITGSTDGIGAETARLFATEGASVIVSGRNVCRGRDVVEEISAAGGRARFVPADLADLDSIQKLAADAGEIDVLVNNAAVGLPAMTVDQDLPNFEQSFAVNVRAPYFLTAALAPMMLARGSGAIVNISTMAASIAIPGMSTYSATKAALNSLTRTWAAEFADRGIRVNTVAAGPTATPMVINGMSPEAAAFIASTTLLKRQASPREIADVVLFLASDRSSYMTGATVAADAGRTAV